MTRKQASDQRWGAPMAFLGVVLVATMFGSCDDDTTTAASPSSASASSPASSTYRPTLPPSLYAPAPGPATAAATASEGRAVAEVIDGDTFELVDGERVRVLGIDSCEMSTDRGQDAKDYAELLLTGTTVTLTREPGVDTDRYGRSLRYVEVSAGDFGEAMVSNVHTGVYEGRNDASPEKLAELRGADWDGRECDEPEPYVAPAPIVEQDDDRDRYYAPETYASPSGGASGHTGDSGHPCGPGDRDGDGDGWCGES